MANQCAETINLSRITKQILKSTSGEFDIESIHTLKLSLYSITDLGCIGECFGLERLDLSQNYITKLYALAGLNNLSYLNLSCNKITSLEGLQALDSLVELNIAGNLIPSMDALRCVSSLEKLKDLRLRDPFKSLSNPVCTNSSYKADVIKMLSSIHTLDGERIRGKGREFNDLCEEVDALIKKNEQVDINNTGGTVGAWTSEGFWDPPPSIIDLEDQEKQLTAMLDQCKLIDGETTAKIEEISKEINP